MQADRDRTVPPRRPPINQSTLVRSGAAHTFEVFVATIGSWWPLRPFSAGQDRVREVVFERHVGGRLYETWTDGTTVTWGDVLAWEPPRRFVITWEMTPATTEVELRFKPLGPALTRVEVEHRGWEALAEADLGADCALPGGYASGSYAAGWRTILAAFAGQELFKESP
ncbi:SRPBCC domain-containing protein [Micromonospora sp. NPDC049559]|uniref:SRPBCC domain-containing protein n=1 Tax=Micromonospora sp. NPDC049559 TaxID=3155923 RepID=UPI003429DA0C